MPPQPSTRHRPRFGRLLLAQAGAGALAAAVAALAGGADAALSAALGAATCLLSQAWFVWRVFGRAGQGDARAMLRAMYRGEAIKLVAIAVILIGIFRAWPEVPPLPLLLGFMAVQAVHWLAPLLLQE